MEKKLNGFNNGRDATDGVGGKPDVQPTEKKRTHAKLCLQIFVTCPCCGYFQNKAEDLVEHLDHNSFRSRACDANIKCVWCNEKFTVIEIRY